MDDHTSHQPVELLIFCLIIVLESNNKIIMFGIEKSQILHDRIIIYDCNIFQKHGSFSSNPYTESSGISYINQEFVHHICVSCKNRKVFHASPSAKFARCRRISQGYFLPACTQDQVMIHITVWPFSSFGIFYSNAVTATILLLLTPACGLMAEKGRPKNAAKTIS